MNAIELHEYGGPERLKLHDVPSPTPGPGQVLVQVAAAGVNFMDIMVVDGRVRLEPLPFIPGVEGAGRVVALGTGVEHLKVGDRVAWFFVLGSYAEQVVAMADALVPIPDLIDDETAAGLMMQGLTASHFTTETYAIKPGDIALVHSAAGGVGQLLSQIIKIHGGTVIARVSSKEKVEIARAAGADHVIVDREGTFAEEVRELANGKGVHVVYDNGGAVTFQDSLSSLRHHGVFVYLGRSMEPVPPIDLADMPRSILITSPTVGDHVRTREALLRRSTQLFDWVLAGRLKVNIGHRFPLAEVAQAHADLAARRTTGKLLLVTA